MATLPGAEVGLPGGGDIADGDKDEDGTTAPPSIKPPKPLYPSRFMRWFVLNLCRQFPV
jgi:hypothetical protein